jgi:hypothetical protein
MCNTISVNKRNHLEASPTSALLALLAGHGGEGEGDESVDGVVVEGWW